MWAIHDPGEQAVGSWQNPVLNRALPPCGVPAEACAGRQRMVLEECLSSFLLPSAPLSTLFSLVSPPCPGCREKVSAPLKKPVSGINMYTLCI